MNVNEIIEKYTKGEFTLEETNEMLEKMDSIFRLNPGKNEIYSDEVEKYGLLSTGTGYFDKVEVKDGKLVDSDMGDMIAFCIFKGITYEVKGDTLIGYKG